MKVLAIVLLCALASVQGRSAGAKNTALVALGDVPYQIHLRIAVSTSGLLNTCSGSLIDSRWVLTAARCVENARFIWVRYGVVNVINPSLVTETGVTRLHPSFAAGNSRAIGLVSINRHVEPTANIAPVPLAINDETPEAGTVCAFGQNEDNTPGEILSCFDVTVSATDDGFFTSADGETSRFDVGTALVKDGVQVGVLVDGANGDSAGTYLGIADYIDWIETTASVSLRPEVIDSKESEARQIDPVQVVDLKLN